MARRPPVFPCGLPDRVGRVLAHRDSSAGFSAFRWTCMAPRSRSDGVLFAPPGATAMRRKPLVPAWRTARGSDVHVAFQPPLDLGREMLRQHVQVGWKPLPLKPRPPPSKRRLSCRAKKGATPRSTVRVACATSELSNGLRTYSQDSTHRPDWTPLTRLAVVPWTLLTQTNSQTNSLQMACVSRVQVDTTATDTVRLQRHGNSSSAHTSARH